jgi:hypothetical protein
MIRYFNEDYVNVDFTPDDDSPYFLHWLLNLNCVWLVARLNSHRLGRYHSVGSLEPPRHVTHFHSNIKLCEQIVTINQSICHDRLVDWHTGSPGVLASFRATSNICSEIQFDIYS